ncbi:hypothetical protein ColTof3_04096 [Colletotrichum tofieldiae]|nr:hypothetical protein ColTof3_04096 [Colletotrichum tofieldiae]
MSSSRDSSGRPAFSRVNSTLMVTSSFFLAGSLPSAAASLGMGEDEAVVVSVSVEAVVDVEDSDAVLDSIDEALLLRSVGLALDSGFGHLDLAVLATQLDTDLEVNIAVDARVLLLELRDRGGEVLGGQDLGVLLSGADLLVEGDIKVLMVVESDLLGHATLGRDGGPQTLVLKLALVVSPLHARRVVGALGDANLLDAETGAELGGAETRTKDGGLVRVDVAAELVIGANDLLQLLLDEGSAGSTTMKDDRGQVGELKLGRFEGAQDDGVDTGGVALSHLLKVGAGKLVFEVDVLVETLEAGAGLLVGAEDMTQALRLLGQLRDGTAVGLDLVGIGRDLLAALGLDELGDHVVDNKVVEGVTAQSPVPTGADHGNLLDGLVELANILHGATLELHDGGLGGASAHVEDEVVLGLSSLVDVGELAGGGIVETNRKTVADEAEDFETGKVSGGLNGALLLGGEVGRDGQDDRADRGPRSSSSLGVLLDALQLHSQKLLDQPSLLLLGEDLALESSGATFLVLLELQRRVSGGVFLDNRVVDGETQEGLQVGVDIVRETGPERNGVRAVESLGVDSGFGAALEGLEGDGGDFLAAGVLGQDDVEGNTGLDEGGLDVLSAEVDTEDCGHRKDVCGKEEDAAEGYRQRRKGALRHGV